MTLILSYPLHEVEHTEVQRMLHQLSDERSCQNDYKICIRTNISYVFIQLDFHKLRDLCL